MAEVLILNQLVYLGAILAGVNFVPQLEKCLTFQGGQLGIWLFMKPALPMVAPRLHAWVVRASEAFVVVYFLRYYRLAGQGYRVSWQKVVLYSVTALVSIYSWSALPFAVALFVVNFYHAAQYYAVVWWAEKGNLCRLCGFGERLSFVPLIGMVAIAVFYGLLPVIGANGRDFFIVGTIVSLLHFWYDGFIWSVRKKQV